ncbi:MAG: hypothetical protein GXO66_07755 [Euryarchaeota archaeon]|nr:hypothetical protein [Euryarchaeota archaeon]
MREVPFFPHQVVRELALSSLLLGLLLILASLVPAPLGAEAQPGEVSVVSPPWYLAPLFGFLALWHGVAGGNLSLGVAIPLLVVLLMLLLPFIDRGEETPRGRMLRRATAAGFVLLMVLLAWFAYSTGLAGYAGLLP